MFHTMCFIELVPRIVNNLLHSTIVSAMSSRVLLYNPESGLNLHITLSFLEFEFQNDGKLIGVQVSSVWFHYLINP